MSEIKPQAKPAMKELAAVAPRVPAIEVREQKRNDSHMLDLDQASLASGRHYRWVRQRRDEYNMSVNKHKVFGYRLEHSTGGVRTIAETDERADGVIAVGDLVLMSCPQAVHDARQDEKRRRREALLASTQAQTKAMAEAKGITLIADTDHGVKQETR